MVGEVEDYGLSGGGLLAGRSWSKGGHWVVARHLPWDAEVRARHLLGTCASSEGSGGGTIGANKT